MSVDLFSSLNGKFDLNSSMSSLYGDYNQIKSGAYGSLMKSYVKKVGNGAALKAYQETGSTTTAADTSSSTTTGKVTGSSNKSSTKKSSFLDSHMSNIKNSGVYTKSEILAKAKEQEKAAATTAEQANTTPTIDTTV